jgi:protein tyrosine phosphatase
VGTENDYINASYIRDSSGTDKYIATQGPIDDSETGRRESTVVDFWRMVWQEKIDCIVMLTQCVENRKVLIR